MKLGEGVEKGVPASPSAVVRDGRVCLGSGKPAIDDLGIDIRMDGSVSEGS